MQKKAVIIGISGQDGGYLALQLLKKGYLVYGTSRDVEACSFDSLRALGIIEKINLCSLSLTDFRSVLENLTKIEPDEVYNLAAQSSVRMSFEQPTETLESISVATLNILEVLRFAGLKAKFYNACSSECFGNTNGFAANEETPFRPRSPYAVAKAAAFWKVTTYRESYGLFACSGILFNHDSPLRPERFVTQKIVVSAVRIKKGLQNKLHLGDLSISRDWGWAPDYVDAMWRMLQQKQPEDFVIATGVANRLEEFVETVFSSLNLNWRDHVIRDHSLDRPSDLQSSLGDASKAKTTLGWCATKYMHEVASLMVKHQIDKAL